MAEQARNQYSSAEGRISLFRRGEPTSRGRKEKGALDQAPTKESSAREARSIARFFHVIGCLDACLFFFASALASASGRGSSDALYQAVLREMSERKTSLFRPPKLPPLSILI